MRDRAMISVTTKMQQNLFFIDSFKLALHFSGNSFAHLLEHFDFIHNFSEQYTDSAVCCRPVTPVTLFGVTGVGSRQQSRYIVPQCCVYTVEVLLKMGKTVARRM